MEEWAKNPFGTINLEAVTVIPEREKNYRKALASALTVITRNQEVLGAYEGPKYVTKLVDSITYALEPINGGEQHVEDKQG